MMHARSASSKNLFLSRNSRHLESELMGVLVADAIVGAPQSVQSV
jgi:hypothetical protein